MNLKSLRWAFVASILIVIVATVSHTRRKYFKVRNETEDLAVTRNVSDFSSHNMQQIWSHGSESRASEDYSGDEHEAHLTRDASGESSFRLFAVDRSTLTNNAIPLAIEYTGALSDEIAEKLELSAGERENAEFELGKAIATVQSDEARRIREASTAEKAILDEAMRNVASSEDIDKEGTIRILPPDDKLLDRVLTDLGKQLRETIGDQRAQTLVDIARIDNVFGLSRGGLYFSEIGDSKPGSGAPVKMRKVIEGELWRNRIVEGDELTRFPYAFR